MNQFHTSPEAEQDVVEHYSYIADRNVTAAERFLVAVNAALQLLVDMPTLGGLCHYPNVPLQICAPGRLKDFETM